MSDNHRRKVSNPLGLAVLGLLLESPAHPHALAATLRERGMDRAFRVTTGSLYDVVRALERAGWIEEHERVRLGGRPERTVYRQTEAGHTEFLRWLDELIRVPAEEFPRFLSAVGYLGALGPEGAAAALRERAGRVRAALEELRRDHRAVLESGAVPRLFVLEAEYAIRMREAELAWIEEVADAMETGLLSPPDPGSGTPHGPRPAAATGPDGTAGEDR
ncbi:PadR family transcriptional regulator [Streptomyces sp. NPDC000594]|uniref:PadR family transcriptional regulator n=1 Tax=Streptomyces sp. NPDC000594 TaxID=3154261 RepID=UPI0033317727